MSKESFGKLIPYEGSDIEQKATWVPKDDEQLRVRRISIRFDTMLKDRHPHEHRMIRSLNLYHGRSDMYGDDRREMAHVAPYAHIFVEAKTAEEVRATQDYVFTAVEDSGDNWKVDLLMDVKSHKDRKVNARSLKHRRIRMKNLIGLAIVRKGYRRVLRRIKERVIDESTEEGIMTKYEERIVPMYDDLFEEIVSPFNFVVDPNATSMADAEDCAHYHVEGYLTFQEIYGRDPRFKNTKHVHPGLKGNVMIMEYFNKLLDEWVILASGDANGTVEPVGKYIEIYSGPLPDDHKELPFVSYHNYPSYLDDMAAVQGMIRSPNSGQDVVPINGESQHRMKETFWTRGDPDILGDLIDLRTGFGRAMFRAAKLAGETIIATAGNFKFDDKKNWRSGDQVVGGMGKFQNIPLGSNNTPNFQFVFDTLFEQMIMVTGVDPRSLTEGKTKTATEASIQQETAMKRILEGIEFNEETGAIRDGRLDLANFQQYYTVPKLVRLTGDEDISKFHDVVKDPKSGVPIMGKEFRRIISKRSLKEYRRNSKFYLKETKPGKGIKSFISRPDYIRSSDIDVEVRSGKNASQIQAIEIEQTTRALELMTNLLPLTQPSAPGEAPLLTKDDLPDIKSLSKKFMRAHGLREDEMGNVEEEQESEVPYQPGELDATIQPE